MDVDLPEDSPCLRCRHFDRFPPSFGCLAGLNHLLGTEKAHKCWEFSPLGGGPRHEQNWTYSESPTPRTVATDTFMERNGEDFWVDHSECMDLNADDDQGLV